MIRGSTKEFIPGKVFKIEKQTVTVICPECKKQRLRKYFNGFRCSVCERRS